MRCSFGVRGSKLRSSFERAGQPKRRALLRLRGSRPRRWIARTRIVVVASGGELLIGSTPVIDSSGNWIGPSSGLIGATGPRWEPRVHQEHVGPRELRAQLVRLARRARVAALERRGLREWLERRGL